MKVDFPLCMPHTACNLSITGYKRKKNKLFYVLKCSSHSCEYIQYSKGMLGHRHHDSHAVMLLYHWH